MSTPFNVVLALVFCLRVSQPRLSRRAEDDHFGRYRRGKLTRYMTTMKTQKKVNTFVTKTHTRRKKKIQCSGSIRNVLYLHALLCWHTTSIQETPLKKRIVHVHTWNPSYFPNISRCLESRHLVHQPFWILLALCRFAKFCPDQLPARTVHLSIILSRDGFDPTPQHVMRWNFSTKNVPP